MQAWRLNVLSAGLLVGCVLGIIFTDGSDAIWGAIIGSVLTVHAIIWTLGGHVDQLPLLRGIWGEESTEDELEKLVRLDPTWMVEHDIPSERGNWDHVVVGRAGVFALESKWTSRPAIVAGNELRLGNVPHPARWFSGAAADLPGGHGRDDLGAARRAGRHRRPARRRRHR